MSKFNVSTIALRWRIVLAFAAVYLIWGSTYLAIRFAIETIPPYLMGGTRFLIAGGALYAVLRWRGVRTPSRLQWRSALIVGGLLLGQGAQIRFDQISVLSLSALGYLVVFGSLIGFTAYVWLLKVSTPARVSTYAFVNPVVAVFLGWMFAGEELSLRVLVAAAVIIVAVMLITLNQSAARSSETVPAPAREITETSLAEGV